MTAVISGFQWGVLGTPPPDLGKTLVSVGVHCRPLRRRAVVLPALRAALRRHDLMAVAISRRGLSKRYRIGQLQSAYGTLRDSLAQRRAAARPARAPRRTTRRSGRCGTSRSSVRRARCSASSGETAPASRRCSRSSRGSRRRPSGRAEIRGRVGSLLEVGTGFHPELTGRENVFLNGAVLGMKRREIAAEVRRDRRVRRRRAVHRHAGEALLERDVRPARVRRRGAPRARDPARRRGARRRRRRVPAAVPRPDGGPERVGSHRALRLAPDAGGRPALRPRDPARERAQIVRDGPSSEVVARYLQSVGGPGSTPSWPDLETAPGDDLVRLRSVRVVDEDGELVDCGRRAPSRSGSRSASRSSAPAICPSSRRSRSSTATATSRSTRWTRARAGTSRRRRATTSRPPGSRATSSTRVSHASTSASARSRAHEAHPHAGVRDAVSFHVQDPGEGDSARGLFTGQWQGRRPAAARLDDRGALSRAGRRDRRSSATRISSSSGRSATSPAFCDRIHVVDHVSTDGTWEILRASPPSSITSTCGDRATRAESHELLEPYAGTDTWVLRVDGDELYDPAGLARFARALEAGAARRASESTATRPPLRRARSRARRRLPATCPAEPPDLGALQLRRGRVLDGRRCERLARRGRSFSAHGYGVGRSVDASVRAVLVRRTARSAAFTCASFGARAEIRGRRGAARPNLERVGAYRRGPGRPSSAPCDGRDAQREHRTRCAPRRRRGSTRSTGAASASTMDAAPFLGRELRACRRLVERRRRHVRVARGARPRAARAVRAGRPGVRGRRRRRRLGQRRRTSSSRWQESARRAAQARLAARPGMAARHGIRNLGALEARGDYLALPRRGLPRDGGASRGRCDAARFRAGSSRASGCISASVSRRTVLDDELRGLALVGAPVARSRVRASSSARTARRRVRVPPPVRDRRRPWRAGQPEFSPPFAAYGYFFGISKPDFERVNGFDMRFEAGAARTTTSPSRLRRRRVCAAAGPARARRCCTSGTRPERRMPSNTPLVEQTESARPRRGAEGLRELAAELRGSGDCEPRRASSSSSDPV